MDEVDVLAGAKLRQQKQMPTLAVVFLMAPCCVFLHVVFGSGQS
jgi:hypothetical protein